MATRLFSRLPLSAREIRRGIGLTLSGGIRGSWRYNLCLTMMYDESKPSLEAVAGIRGRLTEELPC